MNHEMQASWRVGPRLVVCLGLFAAGGCGTGGYLVNRARDSADICTFTVGVGDGLKIQAGPIHVAAVRTSDLIGLRGGQFFANGNDLMYNEEKFAVLPVPRSPDWNTARKEMDALGKEKAKKEGREWKPRKQTRWEPNEFGSSIFFQDMGSPGDRRGKNIMVNSPFPCWVVGRPPSYFSQFEISGGLLLSVRAGFNPGELLDFVIGLVGLDLYRDDVE